MRLTLINEAATFDVELTITDHRVSLAEVFAATGLELAADVSVAVLDETTPVAVSGPIGSLPIRNGSTVRATRAEDTTPVPPEPPVAEIVAIAGPRSGLRRTLSAGTHDVGRFDSDPDVISRPEFRVTATTAGSLSVTPLGGADVTIDGVRAEGTVTAAGTIVVGVGVNLFRITAISAGPSRLLPVAANGRSVLVRPPRMAALPDPAPPVAPRRPDSPREPTPLSWAMILAPIPVGVLMAYFFSPFFLAFTAMSPVMTIGRWYEGRYRNRKEKRREERETAERLSAFHDDMLSHRADVAARRRANADIGTSTIDVQIAAPRLWEKRRGDADFLDITVAYGTRPWDPEITTTDFEALVPVIADVAELPDVPVTVGLDSQSGVGVIGPRSWAIPVCEAMVIDLVSGHGPADVQLALITEPGRLADWDWLKWLPHVADQFGGVNVVTDTTGGQHLVSQLTRGDQPSGSLSAASFAPSAEPEGPMPVFIVDSPNFLGESIVALSTACLQGTARMVVVTESADRLPAVCRSVLSAEPDGRATVVDTTVPLNLGGLRPVLADGGQATSVAHGLARFDDPERRSAQIDLPGRIDLAKLVADVGDAAAVGARWQERRPPLRATIGVAEHGPLEVDFLRDGPHALVAGTTGSGKSELLRTLVASLAVDYSPTDVNFVLVDFKGGGAFDACAALPHTVGVVTDLDEHLAARALRCLKAELRYREERLRDAEVSDLRDLEPGTLPRLMIIVDEFATLAAELPDFMASLVDVAQRGRSLGIHMVLATQRPSGVVDAKIRANTNLRLCLRVQSDADSQDVIGARSASGIDRRLPGRGFAQFGASELVGFQAALVSEATDTGASTRFTVEPFVLMSKSTSSAEEESETTVPRVVGSPESATGRVPAPQPSDLARLVAATRTAAERLDLPAARVPWPDPLPSVLDAEILGAAACEQRWSAPLGLADLPDAQRVEERTWSAVDGNLLIYGLDADTTTRSVATLCYGLARTHSTEQVHLYLLDHAPGGAMTSLAALPHVAAHVTPGDDERLLRLVQRVEAAIDERRALASELGAGRIGPDTAVAIGRPMPLVLLVITSYHAVLAQAEESGMMDLAGRLERIIGDGPDLGVVTVATTSHERGFPSRIAAQVEAKLLFRLADPTGYTAFGFRTRDLPDLDGGRAISLPSREELQVAHYDTYDQPHPVAANRSMPAPVEILSSEIPAADIIGHARSEGEQWELPIGVRHDNLTEAIVTLRNKEHLVVTGGPGSGRTNALKVVTEAVISTGADAHIIVLTNRSDEWRAFEHAPRLQVGPDPESVRSADDGPTLLIIDGLDAVGTAEPAVADLLSTGDTRCVLAERNERLRIVSPWVRTVLESRSGLILKPLPDHGDVLRVRLPIRTAGVYPAGRGYWIDGGISHLVQVAKCDPATPVRPMVGSALVDQLER